jgi:hypothetical protein
MNKKKYIRWYENNIDLNQAVNLLVSFEDDVLEVLLSSFNSAFSEIINDEKNTQKLSNRVLSLTHGTEGRRMRGPERRHLRAPFASQAPWSLGSPVWRVLFTCRLLVVAEEE